LQIAVRTRGLGATRAHLLSEIKFRVRSLDIWGYPRKYAQNLAVLLQCPSLDWRRQQGQKNVNAFDGNQVSAGLKYSF